MQAYKEKKKTLIWCKFNWKQFVLKWADKHLLAQFEMDMTQFLTVTWDTYLDNL